MQAYKRELLNYYIKKRKKMEKEITDPFIYLFTILFAVFDFEYANVRLIIVIVDAENLH